MRYGVKTMLLVVLALAAWSAVVAAQPCVDVEMAFTPASANPGDEVNVFASLENTGDEAGDIAVSVSLDINGVTYGPYTGTATVAAGEAVTAEFAFLVPAELANSVVTVTVEASVGECSDTAVGVLTVGEGSAEPAGFNPDDLGMGILTGLGASPTPNEEVSWGALKTLYTR